MPPQIPEIITKYLNYLHGQKNFSEHTLRAYSTDLSQAYGLNNLGKLGRYQEGTDWEGCGPYFFRHYIDKKASSEMEPVIFDEDQILKLSMKALSNWSHLSSTSRNRKAATLKSFLNWCFENHHLKVPIAERIPLVKKSKKLPNFLSVDESIHLIKTIEEAPESPERLRDLCLILLLYGSGLRVSEACDVLRKNIDLKRGSLKIMGKGSKERIVSMPEFSSQYIAKLIEGGGKNKYLFGESPLNPRKAYQIVRDWGARAGLKKDLHPHALRHSFATQLLISGANLRTLQKVLGHTSLTATEIYTHIDRDHLSSVMDKHHPLAKKTN